VSDCQQQWYVLIEFLLLYISRDKPDVCILVRGRDQTFMVLFIDYGDSGRVSELDADYAEMNKTGGTET
jgi:hypothetical protein